MQVKFDLTVGNKTYTITDEAATQAELIQKLAFYNSIPTTGPNGETDLTFRHRTVKLKSGDGEYFSIVSEQAGQEFNFGQSAKRQGDLFQKGWQELYRRDAATTGGLGETETTDAGSELEAANAQTHSPAPKAAPAPRPAAVQAPRPAAAPKPAAAPAAAKAAPQVNTQVSNVLSKFGLGA